MANKQILTNPNKTYIFASLEQKHQDAVLMHYDGLKYRVIASELNSSYGTVRQWFMTDGICYAAYQELLKEHARENKKKVKKIASKFEEYAPDALETLHESAKSGNWKAAESLLDRAGYSPVQKIKAEVENKETAIIKTTSDEIAKYVKSNITDSD